MTGESAVTTCELPSKPLGQWAFCGARYSEAKFHCVSAFENPLRIRRVEQASEKAIEQ
jgi:hypothetical protein